MNKKAASAIIAVIIVIIAVIVIYSGSQSGGYSSGYTSSPTNSPVSAAPASTDTAMPVATGASSLSTTTVQSGMTPTTQLFASSPYAAHAYQVYPGPLSATATRALDGFDVTTNDQGNGLVTVTLNAKKPGYATQTFTLAAGQKLYFIEKFLGDDQPNDQDGTYGDDHAYAVDANGYILQ